jgi:hypothetical protein
MQWIKCSDRLPTEADGDEFGIVVVRRSGELVLTHCSGVRKTDEWLAGACEREGEECDQ